MRRPAISASSCVTMAWPSAGWWCRHRQPWSAAKASVNKAQQREAEAMEKQLFHLQAQRFETPEAAHAALVALETSWRSHQGAILRLIAHKHYAGKGRPTCEAYPIVKTKKSDN